MTYKIIHKIAKREFKLPCPTINIFYIVSILGSLLICVPWYPEFRYFHLETSWGVALHYFFRSGLQFGSDIIWTFGPYGFVYARQYFPSTYTSMITIYVFLTFIYTRAIWQLLRKTGVSAYKISASILCIFIILCFGGVRFYFDAFFYIGPAIFLLLYFLFPIDFAFNKLCLAIALSCISLIKVSFLLPITFIMLVIAFDSIFSKKKIPWLFIIFVIALLIFWVGAGQSIGSLKPYLLNNVITISSGYSGSMARGPNYYGIIELMIYFSLCLLLLIYCCHSIQIKSFSGILFFLGLLFLFFCVFKVSFVRHDHHSVIGLTFLSAFSILLIFTLDSNSQKRLLLLRSLLILFSITGLIVMRHSIFLRYYGGAGHIRQNLGGIRLLISGDDYFKKKYISIAQEKKLDLQGTVDIYPHDQGLVIVGGLKYQPRPVIQSYQAYNANLSRANANHLKSPRSPEKILFRISAIDSRLPAMDDGLSWPEIWSRYNFRDEIDQYLLFEKAGQNKKYSITAIKTLQAQFDEEISVPTKTGELIWANVKITKGSIGKILDALYKSYPPDIKVNLKNGEATIFRLLPSVSGSGFLLSPIVTDNASFKKIAESNQGIEKNEVVSFKILPFKNIQLFKIFYQKKFEISFSKIIMH